MQIPDKLQDNEIIYREATREEYAMFKVAELKKNLAETDYLAIKFAEGLIPANEYKTIKEQRQVWRDEINRLEKEIK